MLEMGKQRKKVWGSGGWQGKEEGRGIRPRERKGVKESKWGIDLGSAKGVGVGSGERSEGTGRWG